MCSTQVQHELHLLHFLGRCSGCPLAAAVRSAINMLRWLEHRHTDTPTHRYTDTPTHRHADTPIHRHTDTDTNTDTPTQTHTHTHTRAFPVISTTCIIMTVHRSGGRTDTAAALLAVCSRVRKDSIVQCMCACLLNCLCGCLLACLLACLFA
jgi:hypothetical protein